MPQSYDVGSLPFEGNFNKFLEGAKNIDSLLPLLYGPSHPLSGAIKFFEERVVRGLLDKIKAGITFPNFPQFRDMSEMFLGMIDGVEKTREGYVFTQEPSIRRDRFRIPELNAILNNSYRMSKEVGGTIKIKVCVTGPYTLFSLFAHRGVDTLTKLGNVLSEIVGSNIFKNRYAEVGLLSLDEPVFGILSDPLLDYGSEGRETLLKAWEKIFHKARSTGVQTCIHLHNTGDELFWDIKSLNIIESHVNDPIYFSKRTKQMLKEGDKFLKASICFTDFDRLIRDSLKTSLKGVVDEALINQRVADIWTDIKHGKVNPITFLEEVGTMKKRLIKVVKQFGSERVPYAGPECGLRSFPTYECAIECLRRVSEATSTH